MRTALHVMVVFHNNLYTHVHCILTRLDTQTKLIHKYGGGFQIDKNFTPSFKSSGIT